ncbi:MAG: acetyltransferase [Chloroflexia bacterium]|nr:acetyltransferase [Chloroflexia bacterium]
MTRRFNDVPDVQFRKLEEADLPVLKAWLEDPDVAPWYGSDSTDLDALRAEYGDKIRGERRDHSFIIQIDGEDAGYIQCYVIDDHPDYARQIRVDPGAVGIDLFIGEPSARNRGYGAAVIRAFLEQIVFGKLDATVAIIAPEPGNARAIRAYEKVGFVWQKTVHVVDEESPANTGDEYVMRLTREGFRSRDYVS